jgi:hypothetical protein
MRAMAPPIQLPRAADLLAFRHRAHVQAEAAEEEISLPAD